MVRPWYSHNSAQLGFALRECILDAMPFELIHRVRVRTWCAWKVSLAFNASRDESAYPVELCFLYKRLNRIAAYIKYICFHLK